jgi:hypothetical protein
MRTSIDDRARASLSHFLIATRFRRPSHSPFTSPEPLAGSGSGCGVSTKTSRASAWNWQGLLTFERLRSTIQQPLDLCRRPLDSELHGLIDVHSVLRDVLGCMTEHRADDKF